MKGGLYGPRGEKSLGERGEDYAAGHTGAPCPFCGSRETTVLVKSDRQGLIEASWDCDSCDESGPCLADGTFEWMPEGDHSLASQNA